MVVAVSFDSRLCSYVHLHLASKTSICRIGLKQFEHGDFKLQHTFLSYGVSVVG
jgi:hypothetical protein